MSEKLDAKTWRIIWVVILAPFMTQMDSTIVNVSLSAITQNLQIEIATAQWIISGYLLALALMLPLTGWLVDRIGAKRLYLICFTAFTLASLLCGSSRNIHELIGARLIQGMAGGLLAPLTQLMMARVAGNQMVKVFGIAAAPILLAPLFGPIIAGAILKHGSWPWLFYINLPIGVTALVLAMIFIPHDESLIQKRPFDFQGFLMLSPSLVCLLYGFETASHHRAEGKWVFAVGLVLLASFIRYAKKQKAKAIIDIELFLNRGFTIAACASFFANGLMYAGQFLIPLYLINACGLSSSEAGWILAPSGLGMLCMFPLVHKLTERLGSRGIATSGVALSFIGTLPFLGMCLGGFSTPLAMIALFIRGLGQGATGVPSIAAAYAAVSKDRLSYATTAVNIVQRLGGPILTTALAIIVGKACEKSSTSSAQTFLFPFIALIALQLIITFFTLKLPVRTPTNATPKENT